MHKKALVLFAFLFIVVLATPFAVDARHRYHGYIGKAKSTYTNNNPWVYPPKVTPPATSTSPTTPTQLQIPTNTSTVPLPIPVLGEVTFNAYITGYSYWDNTPPGSADISHGVIHSKAGGTGTFQDPITLAVGHSIISGKDILDYPAGTKFYLPYLQKYAIVEDTCGDGNSPQNGPCHTGYKGNPWIDIYVDGKSVSRSSSDSCMNKITGVHSAIKNPGPNYPVSTGSVTETGCKTY